MIILGKFWEVFRGLSNVVLHFEHTLVVCKMLICGWGKKEARRNISCFGQSAFAANWFQVFRFKYKPQASLQRSDTDIHVVLWKTYVCCKHTPPGSQELRGWREILWGFKTGKSALKPNLESPLLSDAQPTCFLPFSFYLFFSDSLNPPHGNVKVERDLKDGWV